MFKKVTIIYYSLPAGLISDNSSLSTFHHSCNSLQPCFVIYQSYFFYMGTTHSQSQDSGVLLSATL
jgi:hypothetical protein